MTTALIAAATSGVLYANAKYHLGRDLKILTTALRVARKLNKRIADGNASLWYDFEDQVKQRADTCCLWYRKQAGDAVIEHTWQQVYDKSLQYAQFFLDLGIAPGQFISTYLINSPEFIFDLLGCWAIGCAPAEINYNLSGDGLVHCLKVSGSSLLIVDEDDACRDRVEAVRDRIENELGMRIVILDDATKAKIASYKVQRPSDSLRAKVVRETPIFMFYTSGTTGHPKAVPFNTERGYTVASPTTSGGTIQPGDRWYDCMPLYHGTGGTTAAGCLISGVTLCIGRRFSTSSFWQDIRDSNANAFVYVGETARYLLAAPASPLDQEHNVRIAFGNGIAKDVFEKFQTRFNIAQISEFFNSSEGVLAMVNHCTGPFTAGSVGHHGALLRLMHNKAYVPVAVDQDDTSKIWRDSASGFAKRNTYEEGGEILVACQTTDQFAGYHNNPDATNKKFERDVFKKGDLYYRSGDALRRDADGRWSFMDRLGDTFRWKSENVSTTEVSEVLGRFPGVLEANVYGATIPGHEGRAGCAAVFIRPEERATFDWTGLLSHARSRLPKYAVPVFIRLVKSPTPIHNNKQNKVPLRNEGIDLEKIATGTAAEDSLLWVKSNTDTYATFTQHDLDQLTTGKARL